LKTMEGIFFQWIFTFTFTLHSSVFIDMLIERHWAMNRSPKCDTRLIYRKRPEPLRVVSFSSLKKTTGNSIRRNSEVLVNSSNGNATDGLWQPMPKRAIEVNVSPSSWSGLHSRVLASRKVTVEAI
jgi:hypothetical protein